MTDLVINPGTNVDPNTGLPQQPAAPSNAAATLNDQQKFVDEWARDPTGAPPVRTFVDPTQQQVRPASGDPYMQAWYDTPLQDAAAATNPSGLPAVSVEQLPEPAPAAAADPAAPHTLSAKNPADLASVSMNGNSGASEEYWSHFPDATADQKASTMPISGGE